MPLSKAKNKERMRILRSVQPEHDSFPEFVQPNRYLKAHINVYPQYESLLRAGQYNPELDPYINPCAT